jgi:hypothetical protein
MTVKDDLNHLVDELDDDAADELLERHPADAYLANLGTVRSRHVIRYALDSIARELTNGRCDALSLD